LSVDGKCSAEQKIAHAMPFMMTIDETFDVVRPAHAAGPLYFEQRLPRIYSSVHAFRTSFRTFKPG
jgi:hypothetical protein